MEFSIPQIISHLWHMGVAYLLAFPIGWDREAWSRGAGLRTFPLVALGACAFMLVGLAVLQNDDAKSRIVYGIITGIGFVGGGAILKERGGVHGTATAASIWNTGAIGVAVAWDKFDIAVILALLNFLTLKLTRRLKEKVHTQRRSTDKPLEDYEEDD